MLDTMQVLIASLVFSGIFTIIVVLGMGMMSPRMFKMSFGRKTDKAMMNIAMIYLALVIIIAASIFSLPALGTMIENLFA